MLKKTISILSVIAAAVMLLIAAKALTNLPEQQNSETTATKIDIDSLKQQIIAYISQNKQQEAQAAIDMLYLDFADNPKIASAVYDIAEAYRNNSKFEQSLAFYKDVIAKWPDSEQAMWAQRGIAISYVALGKLTDAQAELEKLKAGFSTEPNISEAVFNVADAYYWFGKFKEADSVYKYVVDNYPKSDFGMWAQMGLAISGIAEANDVAAEAAIEGLIGNWQDNPKLAEALFYIGTKYAYDRKYEKAEKIYQDIINGWAEGEWAKNAKFETAKIGVFKYLDRNDEPNTLSAIDNLITDFNDRGDLPAAVFDMGARSDWQGKYEPNDLTKNIYDKVINSFPQSPQVVNAKMGLSRMGIISLIDANDDPNAFAEIDKFIADYNNIRSSAEDVFRIEQRYYKKAMLLKYFQVDSTGSPRSSAEEAAGYFYNAITVNMRIIKDLPQTDVTANALFGIGVIYSHELGETQKGIEAFENLLEQFPGHNGEDWTHYLLGMYYKVLKSGGKIEAAKADEKIEQNLTEVVEKYPDSELAPHVALQLAEERFQKGEWQKAAFYYEIYLAKFPEQLRSIIWFLGQSYERMGEPETAAELYRAYIVSADANDPGVKTLKARIEALEGQNK